MTGIHRQNQGKTCTTTSNFIMGVLAINTIISYLSDKKGWSPTLSLMAVSNPDTTTLCIDNLIPASVC